MVCPLLLWPLGHGMKENLMGALCCRRNALTLLLGASTALLVGCGKTDSASLASANAAEGDTAAAKPTMIVYRDPNCGCCGAWADQAMAAGYPVKIEIREDMGTVKTGLNVRADLASCHTVTVAGYVLEGHVPFDHIAKLLAEKPKDIIGLAVPGMPRGSPGMEMPDGSKDEFDVIGFDKNGPVRVFTA